jgi:hypothetical protein
MHAAPLLWIADRLFALATHAFRASLRVVRRPPLHALAHCGRVHTLACTWRASRPTSTYTMLVASDVQHGLRGILP